MTDAHHPDLRELQRELAMAQPVSGLDHVLALLPQPEPATVEESAHVEAEGEQ